MIKFFATIVLLVIPCIVDAQNTIDFYVAYATESITVANSPIGFTSSKINQSGYRPAQLTQFRVECAVTSPCPIRFTLDGTTVTTSVGFILNEGDIINLYSSTNIKNFRSIRTGSNSAIIQPIYYR